MQIPTTFSGNKALVIEIVVLVLFLGGMYYAYTFFSTQTPTVAVAPNEQLLGQDLTLFLKASSGEQFALDKTDFLKSELMGQLRDFSETISPNPSRGRLDPFTPYASSRPIR